MFFLFIILCMFDSSSVVPELGEVRNNLSRTNRVIVIRIYPSGIRVRFYRGILLKDNHRNKYYRVYEGHITVKSLNKHYPIKELK